MENENVATEQVVNEQPQEVSEPKEKTFTQEQVDEIVKKRLAKENAKFEQRLNALEESSKLNAMNEQEKANYQAQKEREAFENERQAFYAERDAFNKAKYKQTIEQQLIEKGLPTTLSDMLVGMSAEEVNQKIIELSDSFGASVNTQIQEKLKQTTVPQEPIKQHRTYLTVEQISAMTPQEYKANRDWINESLKHLGK
jgi:hypothetical protein